MVTISTIADLCESGHYLQLAWRRPEAQKNWSVQMSKRLKCLVIQLLLEFHSPCT